MRERVPMTDFARQWAEHVAASASPRMTDDQAERDFWHAFMTRKTYAPEPSALQVLERLRPLLRARGVETALEVGPGWGSYTLTLAELCREVACVDLSRDVLDFVLRAGAERGRDNITAFHAKWEAFTPERRYDLVFGYNCFYRQADLADCFWRMDRAADKLCVAGMTTGLAPAWLHELDAAGGRVSWEWKDYIYFVGVLYQMGIDANVMVLPFEKELSYPDADALVRGGVRPLRPRRGGRGDRQGHPVPPLHPEAGRELARKREIPQRRGVVDAGPPGLSRPASCRRGPAESRDSAGPLFAWRAGAQPWSFSIMMLRMVRSVSTMPGVLMRPMLRMTCSGVAAQMPSLGLTTTPPTAR